MGTTPTKAADNIYCQCRKTAAQYNDKLNSREGAAELLGVSSSSLADYELGNTKVVPVDKVVLMADLYRSPELKNYYCTNVCPIGENSIAKLEVGALDRQSLKMISAFQNVPYIRDTLLDITVDGVVEGVEIASMKNVIEQLKEIIQHAQELVLWAEKNI